MNCVPAKMAEQMIRLELIGGLAINSRSMPHDSGMLSIDVLVLGHQRNTVVSCLSPNATAFNAFVQRLPLLTFPCSVENSSFWYQFLSFDDTIPDHAIFFSTPDANGYSKPTMESTISPRVLRILLSHQVIPGNSRYHLQALHISISAINAIQDYTLTTPILISSVKCTPSLLFGPLFLQHETIRIEQIEGCVILSLLHAML